MSKSILRGLCFALISVMVIAAFGGCSPSGSTSPSPTAQGSAASAVDLPAEPVTLRFACTSKAVEAETVPHAMAQARFAELVEEKTRGMVKVEIFWDSQLGDSAEQLIGGIQSEAFEIFSLSLGKWGAYTEAFMPFNMPYLFGSEDTVNRFVDGPYGDEMIEKALSDTNGVRLISFLNMGFRQLTNSKKEVITPDDIKGLKIRVQEDPYQIAAFEALGASCISTPFSELYAAMQQGVVDGQENPLINIESSKFSEVQKYLSMTNHIYAYTTIAISEEVLKDLSEEYRAAIFEAAEEAQQISRGYLASLEESLLVSLKEQMQVTELSDDQLKLFQEVAMTSWAGVEKAIGSEQYNKILTAVENA